MTFTSYLVFDGKRRISIPNTLIKEYETKVSDFSKLTIECFILTLELNAEMTNEELSNEIIAAMREDCEASEKVKEILSDETTIKELFDVEV